MSVSARFEIDALKHIDIFEHVDHIYGTAQSTWHCWYHRSNGYVEIHTDKEWTCRQDVEDFVFERMLDGKV